MNRSLYPEFYRISVGFESIIRMMERHNDNAFQGNKYPPHNIIGISEESFLIELALAGFTRDDITITHHRGVLTVIGAKEKEKDTSSEEMAYVHRGISTRGFQKTFNIAEHVCVTGAAFEDGLLSISLELRVPESEKPKQIKIK